MSLADQAAMTGHDGQVTEGQPARLKRRTFTAAYRGADPGGVRRAPRGPDDDPPGYGAADPLP